jgi:hypothetical protein
MRTSPTPSSERGFTLVELMVAVTGGLFVAIAVFMLARDGSRFYQHEARIADATVGAMTGLGRLRSDIARAGFLSSPNVRQDPTHCERSVNAGWSGGWPSQLANLASIRIQAPSTTLPSLLLTDNGRSPDAIVLAGSFSSSEEFPTAGFEIVPGTSNQRGVVLQTQVGPLPRLGYLGLPDNTSRVAFLQGLFPAGRALRIVDPSGMTHYGAIESAGLQQGSPLITLQPNPAPLMRSSVTPVACALTGSDVGRVSVINFVRYELRQMAASADYAPLFANTASTELAAWDQSRTELVREELDVTGAVIAGTTEIVAEHAVDLKFGLTTATIATLGAAPVALVGLAPGAANIPQFAGDPTTQGANPQRIRAVRVRLSVRSAVPDRSGDIVAGTDQSIPTGAFFRMKLADQTYARVRTLQADVALPNHAGLTW